MTDKKTGITEMDIPVAINSFVGDSNRCALDLWEQFFKDLGHGTDPV